MKIINRLEFPEVLQYNFGDVIVIDVANDYSVDMIVKTSNGMAAFLNLKSGLYSNACSSLEELYDEFHAKGEYRADTELVIKGVLGNADSGD